MSNQYFTEEVHGQAILDYVSCEDFKEREKIYRDTIMPVFDELVKNIIYTYKYNSLPNIDQLKDDCIVHLTMVLNKYDKNRNSKAFSYFTVITKNWFKAKIKKNNTVNSRDISYEDNIDMLSNEMVVYNTYEEDRDTAEFFYFLKVEMETWDKGFKRNYLNEQDVSVLQAVLELFERKEEIQIFNKKAIFLYLREMTNINTKQISRSLKKFKNRYFAFKKDWIEGRIDEKTYEQYIGSDGRIDLTGETEC